MFLNATIVEGESAAEYKVILDGVRKDRKSVGMPETFLVEKLATIILRQRRLPLAENAEVQNARLLNTIDSALVIDTWDRSRAKLQAVCSGTLQILFCLNTQLILTLFRDELEKSGFQKGDDLWPLRKLYGLDHDGEAPFGIFHIYQALSMLAANTSEGFENGRSRDELKQTMLEILNLEIEGLRSKQNLIRHRAERKEYYHSIAALVPPPHVAELFIRYEAHLGREFDRTFNQLEHLQRTRRGQPVPRSIKIEH